MWRPGFQPAVKWRAVGVELPFIFFLALTAHGFWAPNQERLENLDRRHPETPTREQTDAVPQVQQKVPGARVDFDPILASPSFVASPHGFLTGSNGVGLAITRQFIDAIPASDPDRATKAFLNEHAALFGHGADVLAQARRTREFVSPYSGLRTVIWEQELGGIPVFQGLLVAHTTQRGELVNISSRFVSDVRKAADAGMPGWLQIQSSPPIAAEEAVARAAASVGEEMNAAEAKPAGVGGDQRPHYQAPVLLGDTEVRQVWLPINRNSLRLCWEVVLTSRKRSEMFRLVVDAETGEILVRHGLTEYYSDATYRVYTSDSPSPYSPACATPCTTQPPLVARDLVTLSALASNDSPAGWIGDGQNTTVGNNVDAHLDKNADDVPDPGSRPTGNPFRVFDCTMDLAQQPVTYTNAVVVQLFYWCNWMHDKLYELGFTEAAGNFQTDNFGRGGLGNDAVQADAQDGSGFNNANFSTPSDGSPGRMQMYIFNYPTPNRDGDLDAEVILHEYTHGLSNRRVGGGVGISALQSGGMGEGWSDFYAQSVLSQTNDDPNAAYAYGGYVTYQLSGLTQNYYFGIRRYPYSTDMTKNPLTFKDIDPAQASAHTGVPRSPIIGTTANEVHNMGEVWCVTLWEARANLIAKYGPALGNQLMLQLVTDGMNLSPANPNFLQARDAILQAEMVDTGGANRYQLWAAFAKRGMGSSATSPASSTTTGLVEAYDLPDSLKVTPVTGLNSSGGIGGPFSPVSQVYAISNAGTSTLNWTAGKTAAWLDISGTSGSLSPGASNTVVITINATANSLSVGMYSDTVTLSNATSGVVQTRSVTLNVSPPRVYYFPLDADPGWTRQGQWAFGKPTGQGGTSHGHPDPTTGATGTNVFGVNLSGDYSTTIGGPYYLTVGPLNFTGYTGTKLQFQRWLNTDYPPYVYATIDVSNDGANWTRIFTNTSGVEIADSSWTKYQYDISAVVDNKATVYVRWGYQVASSGAFAYSGWNIDDVEFLGTVPNRLSVSMPSAATEGDPPTIGTVYVTPAAASNLTVNLASSDTTEVTVPATVTILAGQTNAIFTLTIIDDTELDGPQLATVTASAPGFASGSASITVNDNETATLSIALPATATEGDGTVVGRVLVSALPTTNFTVTLSSSDTTELVVPATVILPAGQTSVVFSAMVVDDNLIDGPQPATVTAHVPGWTDGVATIIVLDNESTNLTVTLPASAYEGAGTLTNAGRVSIAGLLASDLLVNLTSSDTTAAIVPASVTIPAGQTSAVFNVTIVDDTATDGTQPATITASAAGFASGNATINVLDNDVDHFAWLPIANPQSAGTPFSVQLAALDINGATIAVYQASVALSAAGDGGPVVLTPTTATGFSNGVWNGGVRINTPATNIRLTADDGAGHTGISNPFDVQVGPVDHFAWDVIPSPQHEDIPFPVTITAQDAANNTVTGFESTIMLSGILGLDQIPNAILGNVVPSLSYSNPSFTLGYAFTPTNDLQVTHVRHYSGKKVSIWTDTGELLASVAVASVPGTWLETALSEPLLLHAGTRYRVGFYNGGQSYYLRYDLPASFPYGSIDQSVWSSGDAFPTQGDSMRWWFVDLRYKVVSGTPVTVTPTNSGNFTSGIWTGVVTVLEAATNVCLKGEDAAGRLGLSTQFVVQAFADLGVTMTGTPDPVFAGSSLAYSITVTNAGSDNAARVVLADPLPAGASFVSATSSQGSCTQIAGSVTCSLGTVSNDAVATVSIVVQPTIAGILTNTVTVTSSATDSNLSNNVATTITTVEGVASLVVTPVTNLVATGTTGGPFTPSNQTYTLTNNGTGVLSWSVTNTASWVSLSATSGTLAPQATTTVTVSINSSANSLAAGNYNDTVTFTNLTNGNGTTTRSVALTITAPANLAVTPANGLSATGTQGGPFTPSSQMYTLANSGGSTLNWSASKNASWVTLSAASGSLAAGSNTTVTVSINANANSLAVGTYTDNVTFTNTTNGAGSATRGVMLTVNTPGVLSVTPTNRLTSTGSQGGPFTPSSQGYTLSNMGGSPISWAATNSSTWLSLSVSSGTLAAGASTGLTVTVGGSATNLLPGIYFDSVIVTNLTNGSGGTTRMATLSIVQASAVTSLYSFTGGADGGLPSAGLVQGSDGNFYGTTYGPGSGPSPYGTVFRISSTGSLTTLWSFTNGLDGANSSCGLLQGGDGNFYGTTYGSGSGPSLYGTVFQISSSSSLTTLWNFANGLDGAYSYATLVQGGDGNLYGTTSGSGSGPSAYGTVFQVSTNNGTLTTLWSFTNDSDGAVPSSGLVQGSDGNFYGTTYGSGAGSSAHGTVFRISSSGTLTTLHSFGGSEGASSYATLVQGSDGNFYGTTSGGGASGNGTVFRISTNGSLTALWSFTGGSDGASPFAGLVQGSDGNFYGTTSAGGTNDAGTVFRVSSTGVLTTLYSFSGGADGQWPWAGLVQGSDGSFYSTTHKGGTYGYGTVFKLSPWLCTFAISTTSLPSVGGSTSGGGVVACGSNVTVCALANAPCYSFANWTLDGNVVSTSACYTFTPDGNCSLVANFTLLAHYTIATSSSPAGGGSTSGGGTVPCGSNVTVCASANACDNFVNWTLNGNMVSTSACYTFAATNTATLVANFTPIAYSISTSNSPAGGGSTSGGGMVPCGSNVTVCATPNACYKFANWTLNGNLVSTLACYTFAVSNTVTLAAHFTPISTYTISTSSSPVGGGSTSGGGTAPCGSNVTVCASASACYSFANWTLNGNVVSTSACYTFTPDGNYSMVANFTLLGYYTIATSSSPAGSGSTSGGGTVPCGSNVTVCASPGSGFRFVDWTDAGGNLVSRLACFTLVATNNQTLVANLVPGSAPTSLYSFTGGADGGLPSAGLVQGSDGNFYGTTYGPGSGPSPYGTVFQISTNGVLTTLWSFTNGLDGANPEAGLVQGTDGNFYGTTYGSGSGPSSYGTVFRISSSGTLTTLHSFGGSDGAYSYATLVQGNDGNFYGTTSGSGSGPSAYGTVFRISTNGTLTTLWSFTNGVDGAVPSSGLMQGTDGNFYGTTYGSGSGSSAHGTVFRISSSGTLTTLHSFGGSEGASSYATLVQGSDGNFYGTTSGGGASGNGTVFQISSSGSLTTLWSFTGGSDGASPFAGLVQGSDGNFYGTTSGGGTNDAGTVFQINSTGVLTTLYNFSGSADGQWPWSGLVQGGDGSFYSTTHEGGTYGYGTVFKLSPWLCAFAISTTSSPSVGGSTSGGGAVACGSNATVCASANAPCYGFANWTLNGNVVSTSACYEFTADGNYSLAANFTPLIYYTIATSNSPAGGGSTSGSGAVPCGSNATVCANANACYNFVNWTVNGNVVSTSACYTFAPTNTEALVANFTPVLSSTIGTSSSPAGGGSTGGGGTVPCGSNATVCASANACYNFVNWTLNGNAVSTSACYTFAATNTEALVANFTPITYSISTGNSPVGGGSTGGGGTVPCGSNATVCASANACYNFVNWTVNGNAVSTSACYTFAPTNAEALVANFTPIFSYTISTSSSPAGGGSTSGGGTVPCGSNVTVCASANSCYNFANWTLNGNVVSTSACYTFAPTNTETLVAGFTPISFGNSSSSLSSLWSFTNGVDGANSYATLVQGSDGDFYGTTYGSGSGPSGYGTVFRISANGTLTTLWSFTNGLDGANPGARLVQGTDGSFYGTTYGSGSGPSAYGTVFRISSSGSLTTLWNFANGVDGGYSYATLVQGNDGNFYGTTSGSGSGPSAYGTVFRISTNGTLTTLRSFTNGVDGASPSSGLVQGSDGNFYGTTYGSGWGPSAYGTVFRISSSGSLTTLHSFGGSDGAYSYATLVRGSDGNFYGTTSRGASGNGTVFRISPGGSLTNLWEFTGCGDGGNPFAGLVQGSDGNFYGTTYAEGNGYGTAFRISSMGSLTTLWSFTNGLDGANPSSGLVQGSDGNFYGTTYTGSANGHGTVFQLSVPLNPPANQISAVQLAGGNVIVTIPSVAGETYQLQYSDSLTLSNWSDVGGASMTNSIGGLLSLTNFGGASSPQGFYRFDITP